MNALPVLGGRTTGCSDQFKTLSAHLLLHFLAGVCQFVLVAVLFFVLVLVVGQRGGYEEGIIYHSIFPYKLC